MNAERRMQNAEVRTQRRAIARRVPRLSFILAFCILHSASSRASAAPSQEDVFRSIQQNVGERPSDGSKGLALLLGGAGGADHGAAGRVARAARGSRRRGRSTTPGKLLREVMKTVPLKPKELKQLKLLADETQQRRLGRARREPADAAAVPLRARPHAEGPPGEGGPGGDGAVGEEDGAGEMSMTA